MNDVQIFIRESETIFIMTEDELDKLFENSFSVLLTIILGN